MRVRRFSLAHPTGGQSKLQDTTKSASSIFISTLKASINDYDVSRCRAVLSIYMNSLRLELYLVTCS